MMKKNNTTYLIALCALVFASCSESDGLSNGIALSKEKIAFAANVVNGWNGNSHTRVQNGIAEYHGPLKMTSNTKQQLYLHPIIQNGVYFYNQEGELVTRDGIAISKGGNKIISTTRGSLAQDVNSGFGISAIYNDGTDKVYFVNNKATKVGDFWFTENKDEWPASTNGLSFYAYAPHSNDNSMLRLADGDKIAQSKQIQYEASSTDIVNQPDFVVANSKDNKLVSGKAQPSVNLTFSHALTAISFVAAKDIPQGIVKSVSIKGVKGKGIYGFDDNSWVLDPGSKDYSLALGSDGNGMSINGTEDVALTTNNQYFMMLPQNFETDESKVEIVYQGTDGTLHTLETSLKDTEWQAGHTVTYRLSSSSLLPGLEITTVSYPQDWVGKYMVDNKSVFNSAYKDGDAIGIYAINARGEVTQANVKATYDDTKKWSLPGGEKLRNNATISYFAYFPYVKDGDQKLASMPKVGDMVSPDVLSSEHAFFKGLEDNWEVKDQSTLEKLNAADLQVCKAVLDKTASGLNLTMQHGVGLADITLGEGLNYKLENYEEYKWTASIVSDKLADNESKLYKPVVNQMLGVVKANHDTTFKGVASGGWKCAWKNELTFNPTCAQIIKKTAEREDGNEHLYTLEVGDIYYTNGALTHQNYDLETIQPIGIVGYITMNNDGNYWTEKDTKKPRIGGHALVMSLKTIGSYCWNSADNYGGRPQYSPVNMTNSASQNYGSGYNETKVLVSLGTAFEAANAAINYNSECKLPQNTTGWFLPSGGQFYALALGLGKYTGTSNFDWGYLFVNDVVLSRIQSALKKVGDDNYTPLKDNYITCQLKYTCKYHVALFWQYGNGYGFNCYYLYSPLPLRPFFAF